MTAWQAGSTINRDVHSLQPHQIIRISHRGIKKGGVMRRYVPNKSHKAAEGFQDVGVGGSGFTDGGAQFCVAQSSEDRKYPSDGPHDEGQPEGARV